MENCHTWIIISMWQNDLHTNTSRSVWPILYGLMIKMLQYKMYPAGELRCPTTALVALFLLHGWWISGFMTLSMLFQSIRQVLRLYMYLLVFLSVVDLGIHANMETLSWSLNAILSTLCLNKGTSSMCCWKFPCFSGVRIIAISRFGFWTEGPIFLKFGGKHKGDWYIKNN